LRLFLPDPARARGLDDAVRHHVAGSLASVADALAPALPSSRPVLDRLIRALRDGPVRPAVVAIYSDIVLAISAEDERRLTESLAQAAALDDTASSAPCRPVTLRDDDLGPGLAASYRRHADDDPEIALDLAPADPAAMAEATRTLAETTRRIAAADPDLAGELAALVREVVFATNDGRGPGFGGATTFYLWGANILNIEGATDPLGLAEALVHEAAHTRLLGETLGRPLVTNPEDERFASPLRPDPRPMEGIVHASYVVARLHYLAGRLFTGAERDARQAEHRQRFRAGDEIIMRHAAFTPTGAAIYAATREYMAATG
jgi:HEXXH motif-containing protein